MLHEIEIPILVDESVQCTILSQRLSATILTEVKKSIEVSFPFHTT